MSARPRAPFEAVVFDAAGVLLMPDPAAFRIHLAPFGVEPDDEACRRAHYVGMAEIDRIGRTDYVQADRAVARCLGVGAGRLEEAAAAVNVVYRGEPFIPVKGAAEALLRLRRAGLALAIVSNAEGTVEAQLADHRICSVDGGESAEVAIVVDSHLVGVEKPDPGIFAFALEALGLAPGRCCYVGDSVHFDVNGARAAGLVPVHLSPYPLCASDGHAHIGSLPALVEHLVSERPGAAGGPVG